MSFNITGRTIIQPSTETEIQPQIQTPDVYIEINEPLRFWFINSDTRLAFARGTIEQYQELLKKNVDLADDLISNVQDTLKDNIRVLEKIRELENELLQYSGAAHMYPLPQPLNNHKQYIQDNMDKYLPEWYKLPIEMPNKVNGYKRFRYNKSSSSWISFEYFLELEILYNEPNTMTEKEFLEKYDTTACHDWSKQNAHGVCFGGYWKYPEHTPEYKNAGTLTREANGKALYKLPYSHALIFETIRYGCSTRYESVRYTSFMCEYVKLTIHNKKIFESIISNHDDII
jgi:hypothetical protein